MTSSFGPRRVRAVAMPAAPIRRVVGAAALVLMLVVVSSSQAANAVPSRRMPSAPVATQPSGASSGLGTLGTFPAVRTSKAQRARRLRHPRVTAAARGAMHRELVRERAARRRSLRSRVARHERATSRTRFHALAPAAAITALRTDAPQVAVNPAWQPPQLDSGQRVLGYESANTMRVSEPGSRVDSLVESTWPLVAATASGALAPIDLTLRPQGAGGWHPANATSDLSIGATLGSGLHLGEPGGQVAVHPSGSKATPGAQVGQKIFYANSGADTDTIVDPTPDGVSVAWALRSPTSPEQLALDFDLPAGARIAKIGTGAQLMVGNKVFGAISAPVAVDAQGTPVPVDYSISGSSVRVNVAHRARDIAYPVSVDPLIYLYGDPSTYGDQWAVQDGDSTITGPQYNGWTGSVAAGYSGNFSVPSNGTSHFILINGGAYNGSAAWMMSPQNSNVYFYAADFVNVAQSATSNACTYAGLWNWGSGNPAGETGWGSFQRGTTGGGAPGMFGSCGGMASAYVHSCASGADCNPDVGTGGNNAGMQTLLYGSNPMNLGSSQFDGGYLWLRDRDNPTITSVTGINGAWTNNRSVTASVSVTDPGLGVGQDGLGSVSPVTMKALVPGGPYFAGAGAGVPFCDGRVYTRCPQSASDMRVTLNDLPDGQYPLDIVARDMIGHRANPYQPVVSIDARAPVVSPSGHLYDIVNAASAAAAAGLPVRSVSRKTHLAVTASDANSKAVGGQVSGLADLTLTLSQGSHTVTVNGTSTGANTATVSYDFVPRDWNLGAVTFTLTSHDNVGNTSTRSFTVNVARGSITSLIEGQRTAKRLVLQAQDDRASLGSPATSVTFQYRKKSDSQWRTIDSNLQMIDGSAAPGSSFAMTDARSPQVVWNIVAALGTVTEPVFVRGHFSDADGEVTNDLLTGIDQSGQSTDDKTTAIGPGTVDELTGNFALTDADVSIDTPVAPLAISRTYNSRASVGQSTGPLGPGWTLGTAVTAAGATFTKVVDYGQSTPEDRSDDDYGVALMSSSVGDELPFQLHENDNKYDSLDGEESLQLERTANVDGSTTGYTLHDQDTGETLTFTHPGGAAPGEYDLESVHAPTSDSSITFVYGNNPAWAAAGRRVTDIVAPVAPNLDCTSLDTTGCRSLHLTWTDYRDAKLSRVTGITYKAPGTDVGSVPVATYDYDDHYRLIDEYDPRITPYLMTTYTYDSHDRLATITPPGEQPWTLAYQGIANDPADTARLASVTRQVPVGADGTLTTATQSVAYGVPLSGSGAPNDMSPSTLAAWAQVNDIPTDATALFRPDDVPASPPSSYAKATVSYLDALGRQTNEVRPGGEATTTEHDAAGNITMELTAANRARALATGTTAAAHAAAAQQLNTTRIFAERTDGSGWRLMHEGGPSHSTRLANGTTVQARRHIENVYDDSDPDSKSLNLPIQTTESAYVAGTGDLDSRKTTMTYDHATGLQTSTTVDPDGLNLTTRTEYNSLGQPTYQEQPRSSSHTAASTRHTIYYTVGANSEDSACGNNVVWASLPCKVTSGGSTTGSLPSLPVSVYEYDGYDHQTKKTDYVDGTSRRVQVDAYTAGRHASRTVTGTIGDSRPSVDYGYSSTTGRLLTTTAQSSPAKVVSRAYNAVGDISSYTDADGGTTTTAYDIDQRPTTITDPSGTRTIAYDATTGRTSSIAEPQLGTITTGWTADGALSTEVFPNANVKLSIDHDEAGAVTGRSYVDQPPCSSGCTVYSDSATRSIHDQWMTQTGTDKTRTFAYDAAGRMTSSTDAPGGTGCVTKAYTYDADGNRLTRRTYPAGSGGACSTSTTPTTQTLTYDEADRVNNSGYAYDALGRITTVPAVDAGGTNALTNTYYNDDRAHTLTQGGTTTTLDLDPVSRVRQRTVGPGVPTVSHYGDDSDDPAWTTQGATTLRNSEDANGDQIATVGTAGGSSGAWTGPTTSVLDNFNRADGGLGANWSVLPGSAAGAVSSNQATIGTPWGFEGWNANSYTGEGEVYVTVPAPGTTTGEQFYIGMNSGWSTGRLNGYQLTYTRGATNDTFQLSKATNGANSALGTAASLSGHLGAGDKIALTRESGGKLKTWRLPSGSTTWAQVGSTITDTTYFEGGQAWQLGFGAGSVNFRFDDFGGGQITWPLWSATKLELSDLHGDVVSEVPNTTNAATSPLAATDAFGAPTTAAGANLGLGYLGAKQRNTALSSGTIEMGARLYQPQIGRFLQVDPVYGGSLNAYDYVNQDPSNQNDLSGNLPQIADMRPGDFCRTYGNYVGCLSGRLPPGMDRAAQAIDRCLDKVADDAITETIAFGVSLGKAARHGGKKEVERVAKSAARELLHHAGSILTAVTCVRGIVNR